MVSFIISFKVKNTSKLSAFECGFSSIGSIHTRFSVHFYIVLVVFVLFDLELVLLVGILLAVSKLGLLLLFLFVVSGMYFEWYIGKLTWMV